MHIQVEHVARAFYDAEGDGQSWDREPEILKDEFRQFAREAMALLGQEYGISLPDVHAFDDAEMRLVA